MDRALSEIRIEPIKTTAPFCRKIINHSDFKKGRYHTGFINQFLEGVENE